MKLAIEVDGSVHNDEGVKANDKRRQSLLEQDALTILRFTNEEVINELEKVVTTFEKLLNLITIQNKSSLFLLTICQHQMQKIST